MAHEDEHDGAHPDDEPLGPLTPDESTAAGDTTEAHDDLIPEDLPLGHPARRELERRAAEQRGGAGDEG